MSKDFLVEIGTEELPPKVLRQLSETFAEGITKRLADQQLSFTEMTAYAAPRRLAVVITDLAEQTPDQDVVSWGPPAKVAFGADGQPTKAAEAFARKNGLEVAALAGLVENDGQQDKLCVRQTLAGSNTEALLGEIINQSLAALTHSQAHALGPQSSGVCAAGAVGCCVVWRSNRGNHYSRFNQWQSQSRPSLSQHRQY